VVCRVLPDFTRTAATRFHRSGTLSPCSQSHARLAGPITGDRWWALTPPFHPLPASLAGLLSVAVVVNYPFPDNRPHLRFRGATFQPQGLGESREVPLQVLNLQRRLLLFQYEFSVFNLLVQRFCITKARPTLYHGGDLLSNSSESPRD
jgi:hypothetical protein